MALERKSDDDIEAIAQTAVEDAISFIDSEISPDRDKAQRYYNGQVDIGHDEGRSQVIATKCRDVVRQVKPSLMRVFLSNDKPGEFIPRTPQDVQGAEQATKFAEYKVAQNDGYTLLNNAFHDALVKKVGILKAFWDESTEVEFDDYTGVTDEEFAFLAQDKDAEIIEHTATTEIEIGPDGQPVDVTTHDAKVSRERPTGDIKIMSVPPEDFFVDSQASNLDDFYVVGHKTDMRIGDLVSMGFKYEDVQDLGQDEENDDEADLARRGYMDSEDDDNALDPSMAPVTVYEAYMNIDVEGTGIPRLYSIIMAGTEKRMLSHELADFVPFAVFEIDPEPHAFFGSSLVDILVNDQDTSTSMWRGLIDNINVTNNPGMAFDPEGANPDDMMNNEIGKLVRTKGPPSNSIMPFVVPFSAGQTIPAMEYFDQMLDNKTGVSRVSMGLDPDALQNATATAVNAAVGAGEGQMEAMARNLGEGGLRQLYAILLQLIRQHVTAEELIMVDGQFVPVDPRSWTGEMGVMINVGLGRGGKQERMMTLQQTLQFQQGIWQSYGPGNGLVTLTGIRNTLADIQKLGSVYNTERYYQPMSPEREQELAQQAAQAAQQAQQSQGPDPQVQAFIQVEQGKAQLKQQTDMAKIQSDSQTAAMKEARERFAMGVDDDLARDKMIQDLAVEVAKIMGQYGTSVDVASVQASQAAPRELGGGNV